MSTFFYTLLSLALSACALAGIHFMNKPQTAVRGNNIGAAAMTGAIVIALFQTGTLTFTELWAAMACGSVIGLFLAAKVQMIQMPQLVALLNGLGGAASALVALLVLADSGTPDTFSKATAAIALALGALTFSGSMVATGKLHQILPQKAVVLKFHSLITYVLFGLMGVLVFVTTVAAGLAPGVMMACLLLLSLAFGVIFTMRVGGADMPITISLLNSLTGVAGAGAGMAIADPLLVAVCGIVGASGLLLTRIMCRAMNRSLADILFATGTSASKGREAQAAVPGPACCKDVQELQSGEAPLASLVRQARKVLIVPGYGMALSQAQHDVKQLADELEKNGATVDFAIHPVAGRMPGHMNVLLAEAAVDYEHLLEMDVANPLFAGMDLVVVVGANDVINPAANTAEDTPIYGMPILAVDDAKTVVICNFDTKPGYAGVPNPLYEKAGVTLMEGDARKSVQSLTAMLA